MVCLQHVRRDAARRAGLPATADPCINLKLRIFLNPRLPQQLDSIRQTLCRIARYLFDLKKYTQTNE